MRKAEKKKLGKTPGKQRMTDLGTNVSITMLNIKGLDTATQVGDFQPAVETEVDDILPKRRGPAVSMGHWHEGENTDHRMAVRPRCRPTRKGTGHGRNLCFCSSEGEWASN